MHPQLLTDLSKLWMFVFAPCFSAQVMGMTLTTDIAKDISKVVFWAFFQIILAFSVSRIVLCFVPDSCVAPSFRPAFSLACSFPNALALPLLLLDTICKSERFINDETAFSRASAYLFTYTLAWGLVFWPVATYILQNKKQSPKEEETPNPKSRLPEGFLEASGGPERQRLGDKGSHDDDDDDDDDDIMDALGEGVRLKEEMQDTRRWAKEISNLSLSLNMNMNTKA